MSSPEATEAVKAAPGASKNVVLIALVAVNMVGLLGVGAYVALAPQAAVAHAAEHEEPEAEEEEEGEAGPIVEFPTMVVNLADAEGARYLKLTFQMELATIDDKEHVTTRLPRLRDGVLSYLSTLTAADVRGPTNMVSVREHLHELVMEKMGEQHVKHVYLTEFLVQ